MNAPTRYQFLIDGEVSDRVKAAFPELSVASAAGGFTSLYGPVADDPQVTVPYPFAGIANLTEHPFHRVSTLSDALQTVFTQLNLCSLSSSRTRHRSPTRLRRSAGWVDADA